MYGFKLYAKDLVDSIDDERLRKEFYDYGTITWPGQGRSKGAANGKDLSAKHSRWLLCADDCTKSTLLQTSGHHTDA